MQIEHEGIRVTWEDEAGTLDVDWDDDGKRESYVVKIVHISKGPPPVFWAGSEDGSGNMIAEGRGENPTEAVQALQTNLAKKLLAQESQKSEDEDEDA